jgi:Protein of unknown function (DUF2971)
MTHPPLYKYRSTANWQFLEDIVVNRRLYAAPFRDLNDPMEGLLYLFDKDVSTQYRDAVRSASDELRVCSLCASRTSSLLWSYYADGHKGVAIGVTVLDQVSPRVDKPEQVTYDMTVNIDQDATKTQSPSEIAKLVLKQKLQFWYHEEEYRVFTTLPYVPVEVNEIVLGCRILQPDADQIRQLVALVNPKIAVVQLKPTELYWPGNQPT